MVEGNHQEEAMRALDQLLLLLRMPSSPDQEQQVVSFLSRNPSLMAAFINHRLNETTQHEQAAERGVNTKTEDEEKK